MKRRTLSLLAALGLGTSLLAQAQEPVIITHVNTLTGALRAYGEQLHIGLRMGFEYATDGTMTVEGRPIKLIEKDDQMNPARARALVEAAFAEDDSHIVIGTISSGVALAVLPLAEELRAHHHRPGCGRQHHRRRLEPLRLPHRPQLVAGRRLQCRRHRQARRLRRDHRPGLRLRPRRRGGVQGGLVGAGR